MDSKPDHAPSETTGGPLRKLWRWRRAPRPTRDNKVLVKLAPVVLAIMFAVGGYYLYRASPIAFMLRFEVSPSFRTSAKPIRREALVELKVDVMRRLETGKLETIASAERSLGAGLASPLTPPMHLTLPRGNYQLSITLRTADDRQVRLMRGLVVDKEDEQRLQL